LADAEPTNPSCSGNWLRWVKKMRFVLMGVRPLLISALLLFAPALPAQSTTSSRFRDPGGITGDPTGLRRDTSVKVIPGGPHYPWEQQMRGITAVPVVAYVLDTTGRVEIETVSFLNSSPAEFVDAVCAFLPKLRFEPFIVGDIKSRVLLVELYGFTTWKHLDRGGLKASQTLVTQSQEEFSTSPMARVVARLEALPHCRR
jgi:hypothetical protein